MSSFRALNAARTCTSPLRPTNPSILFRQTRPFSLFGFSSDPTPEKTPRPSSAQSDSSVSTTQTKQEERRLREDHHKDLKDAHDEIKAHHKTLKEMDDELMAKMAGISGDGGDAGVEYEDGQPVAMKRR